MNNNTAGISVIALSGGHQDQHNPLLPALLIHAGSRPPKYSNNPFHLCPGPVLPTHGKFGRKAVLYSAVSSMLERHLYS